MREAGGEAVREIDAFVAAGACRCVAVAGRGFRKRAVRAVEVAVVAVKFVSAQHRTGRPEHAVPSGLRLDIAEAHQPRLPLCVTRQNTAHRNLLDGLQQIHVAAALGDRREPLLYCFRHGCPHRSIGVQCILEELRIATGQDQTVDLRRQCRVMQRAERHELRAELPKQRTILLVGEVERFVLGHRDPHRLRPIRLRLIWFQWRLHTGDLQQPLHLHAFFHLCGDAFRPALEVFDFSRLDEPEVAGRDLQLRQLRQVAENLDARTVRFDHALQARIEHRRHAVQDQTADAALPAACLFRWFSTTASIRRAR